MKLYKYKSLSPLDYVADLLVQERLYCSPYSDLNDPFEGVFRAHFAGMYGDDIPSFPTIMEAASLDDPNVRVCSLSASLEETRLWCLYADGHRGIAIEIDFSGLEDNVRKVGYTDSLISVYADSQDEQPTSKEMLYYKTHHWQYEEEYRFIQPSPYFDIRDKISNVFVGYRTTKDNIRLLERMLPKAVSWTPTYLNPDDVVVRPIDVA